MRKNLWIFAVLMCLLLLSAGCGSDSGSLSGPEGPEISGAETLDDGREVGGYADGELGDRMENVFFAYTVNEAALAAEYEGQTPAEGSRYLIAEITVENIFDDPLPMYAEDFQVQWGDDDDDEAFGYPIAKFADAQMEDEYELAADESVTKTLVYEVPALEGENEYSISYLEYYDDDVEGNVFFVYFTLEMAE